MDAIRPGLPSDGEDGYQRAVNLLQEEPSTSLTDIPLQVYQRAKIFIARWDPFNGITVAELEREENQ